MPQHTITSLAPAIWKSRMRAFLIDCVSSAPEEQGDRIREAVRLLHRGRTPGHFLKVDESLPAAVEAMVESRAFESAVLLMIGTEASFMVSRGADGLGLGSVIGRGGRQESLAEGATPALALLAAYVSALLDAAEENERG